MVTHNKYLLLDNNRNFRFTVYFKGFQRFKGHHYHLSVDPVHLR